jgi:hypothetical protein
VLRWSEGCGNERDGRLFSTTPLLPVLPRALSSSSHLANVSVSMIIVKDDQDKHDSYNGPTIRPPERVARRRRSLSPLPDYEASEAQYRKSFILDHKLAWHQSRMWRAILFLLLTYTLLTIVVGVPIIVTVSQLLPSKRQTMANFQYSK